MEKCIGEILVGLFFKLIPTALNKNCGRTWWELPRCDLQIDINPWIARPQLLTL